MEKIFPHEIIMCSAQKHFSTFSRPIYQIYCTIIIALISGFVLLFFIHVDITIVSKGIIRSANEAVPIMVPVTARIDSFNFRENTYVQKGDTLIWLNCDILKNQIEYKKSQVEQNNLYITDLESIIQNNTEIVPLNTSLIQKKHDEYKQRIYEFDLNLKQIRSSYNRNIRLFNENVIPPAEINEVIFQLKKKEDEKEIFKKLSMHGWQSQIVELKQMNREYENEIQILMGEIYIRVIEAPHSGYIMNYNGVLEGSFVAPGQTIAVISSVDSLITEHWISPKDIGFLNLNLQAKFQVDAYDYNLWGMASGEIVEISNDVYFIDNKPFYRVRCSINEKHLISKNGRKGELKSGITLTTRFIVTEKSISQLVFEKIDQWFNPYLK